MKYGLKQIITHDIITTVISWSERAGYELEFRKEAEMIMNWKKEARKKQLDCICRCHTEADVEKTSEMIEQLVEERRRQGMTQQNLSDITGILPPNLAETGEWGIGFRRWLYYKNMHQR